MTRPLRFAVGVLLILVALPAVGSGQDRFALIVSGASGDATYAQRYDRWRTDLVSALIGRYGFRRDRMFVLADHTSEGVELATRENVERSVRRLAAAATPSAFVLVVLIGHGGFDGERAKFALVGPDLDVDEWKALIERVPGHLVFVDTTSCSDQFLKKLAREHRITITATDAGAQRYETLFPEYFVKAFTDPAADADKDGRLSVWEVFEYASAAVKRAYEEQGRLPTEHAVVDDTGDGMGRELGTPVRDGDVARATFLDDPAATARLDNGADVVTLQRRRDQLLVQLQSLKNHKAAMPADEYARQLEQLLIELAKVSREIRSRS